MTTSDHVPGLVLLGARIWTPGPLPRDADSVAIVGDRIVAVGSRVEVGSMIGSSTRVVELGGRMLLPGFQDAHVHPILGGLDRLACDLSDVAADPSAYHDTIRAYAASIEPGGWVVGSGWTMAAFPGGNPGRGLLDVASPDRPAYLASRDGHSAWVNSRALALAGVTAGTEDPPLGRVERDAFGEPTGTLHEHAMDLIAERIPDPGPERLVEALRIGQAYLHELGITAWQDATVDADRLAAYLAAEARGLLTGRVSASLEWDEKRGPEQVDELIERGRTVPSGSRIRATTIKIFQDGIIENRTAGLLEPYLDASGAPGSERGQARLDPATFAAAVTRLEREGYQVHVHAIGDRAVRDALDAFQAGREANGPLDSRHHVAHIQLIDPADIPRFSALDVTANAQPYWAVEDGAIRDLTRPFLGDERTGRMYPFASLLRAGARLAMGSDWNVTTADPLLLLEVAVRRIDPDDRAAAPFVASEAIGLEEGLRAFTAGSAFLDRLDDRTAAVEIGRLADLVLLDRDILAPGAGPPGDARVLMTLVGGVPVYEADEARSLG